MLLTCDERISVGDVASQALMSRLLTGLVLNESASVNQPLPMAFNVFAERCLEVEVAPEINDVSVAVSLSDKCWLEGEETRLDLVISLGKSVWGIQAFYTEAPDPAGMWWKAETLRMLSRRLGYDRAGMLFILPEQALLDAIRVKGVIRNCLIDLVRMGDPVARVSTWEMVLGILAQSGTSSLTDDLARFCEARNRKSEIKLSTSPSVPDSATWEALVLGTAGLIKRTAAQPP
jgi:hypothetical protein